LRRRYGLGFEVGDEDGYICEISELFLHFLLLPAFVLEVLLDVALLLLEHPALHGQSARLAALAVDEVFAGLIGLLPLLLPALSLKGPYLLLQRLLLPRQLLAPLHHFHEVDALRLHCHLLLSLLQAQQLLLRLQPLALQLVPQVFPLPDLPQQRAVLAVDLAFGGRRGEEGLHCGTADGGGGGVEEAAIRVFCE